MKLKKKENQIVATSLILRMGSKISMGGVTEKKFSAEMKGKTIQRLPPTPRDPSLIQPPNPDTIAYARKILLTGP